MELTKKEASEYVVQTDRTDKEGNPYFRLDVKPKPMKGVKGLAEGEYIIVKKNFADAQKKSSPKGFGDYFITTVGVGDKNVTLFMNLKEGEDYNQCGGLGDEIKLIMTKVGYTNPKTGAETMYPRISFEKV